MSKDVDKRARQIVKISKLDAEDFTQMPNDFEECVEFVKENFLLRDPADPEYDNELDDLIFERAVQQIKKEYAKHGVKLDVKLIPVYDDDDPNQMYR